MEYLEIVLIAFGALVAVGGVVLMFRSAARGEDARRGYLPLGMIVVGLIIAYRPYSSFGTIDPQDITIMFIFAVALLGLLGLQFLVVERNRRHFEQTDESDSNNSNNSDSPSRTDIHNGNGAGEHEGEE